MRAGQFTRNELRPEWKHKYLKSGFDQHNNIRGAQEIMHQLMIEVTILFLPYLDVID